MGHPPRLIVLCVMLPLAGCDSGRGGSSSSSSSGPPPGPPASSVRPAGAAATGDGPPARSPRVTAAAPVARPGTPDPADPVAAEMAALERWLAAHAPGLLPLLNPPATGEQIAAFERAHGVTLPPPLARLYRLHEGESSESHGIFGCMRFLPLAEAGDLAELDGMRGKVPFLQSGGGDLHCLRGHDPARPEPAVYDWWHEQPTREDVVAPSLEAFLKTFREAVERGDYVYRPDEANGLIDKNEL